MGAKSPLPKVCAIGGARQSEQPCAADVHAVLSAVIAPIFPCQPVFPILLSLGLFGPLIIPPKYHYYTTYSPLY